MLGKEIDMEKLMRQNELMPAVGNMRVNARGDELGSGGQIVRRREEVVSDYYEQNPNAILKTNAAVAPLAPSVGTEVIAEEKTILPTRTKKSTEE
jgi:hypothetical protein